MNPYVSLLVATLLPLMATLVFVLLGKIRYYDLIPNSVKQVLYGVTFGLIAVWGTENGIPINGAVVNARDGAVLTAGLVFGGPAGIIAGLIGGIERWFSVYWGVGSYTRVACTISTIITGLFGASLKKKMFEDKIPQWNHALLVGAVAETWHMLMVFITNMSDIKRAFTVVKLCAAPMIIANALSVTLAVLAINILDKDANFNHGKITL